MEGRSSGWKGISTSEGEEGQRGKRREMREQEREKPLDCWGERRKRPGDIGLRQPGSTAP